jgi:hypothetical protein
LRFADTATPSKTQMFWNRQPIGANKAAEADTAVEKRTFPSQKGLRVLLGQLHRLTLPGNGPS